MNTVNLIGRITRENDLRYSQSGTAVLRNSIAINRKFKRDETDFINLLAFGKTAELITNHVNKGDLIGIEGHINTGSYEKEGRKVYTFDVMVDNVTFISNKGNTSGNQNNSHTKQSDTNQDPFAVADEDGLPF